MGPFTLADTVGIDVGYKVATPILNQEYGKECLLLLSLKKCMNQNIMEKN